MGISKTTVLQMAREVYGVDLSEQYAAKIVKQVTRMLEAPQHREFELSFNEELLSSRQVLMRESAEGGAS